MAEQFNIIAEQNESTVVARYERSVRTAQGYQSEDNLERAFIKQLVDQGYEYANWIHEEKDLLANLRKQLEKLNEISLSDTEWKSLLGEIANEQLGIKEKAFIIQKSELVLLKLDNGDSKNIRLIDKSNIHRNFLQVINQYREDNGTHRNRYDVTILVNGLPLVHIELKRRGVSIREAFNQINRYQRDSFWAGRAMFDYVQIFVISNGTETKYYSNTTRFDKEEETARAQRRHKNDGHTFEFTSYWSDQNNKLLPEIGDFTATFFSKHTLLNVLTKYCVLNTDNQLLVMRPYQITATEKILNRIDQALLNHKESDKWLGTKRAGGFIWHTTGSGKTLTSFKTAQLASRKKGVDKVLFVVDRKDLDYQTMKEYDSFEKDSANSNSNGTILRKQLVDSDAKIIITTIQKLSGVLKKPADRIDVSEVLGQNVVLIFDECHRSQFGDMHDLITKKFKRYMLFGFTGTPIFPVNSAGISSKVHYRTTAEAFGGEMDENGKPTKALHTYTVVDAIRDKNVLGFHVDYERTMRMREGTDTKLVWGIDTDEALHSPKRIKLVTQYILDNFGRKTKKDADVFAHSKVMNVKEVVEQEKKAQAGKKVEVKAEKKTFKTRGFNSIFAVDSVKTAIQYYDEFKRQMDADPTEKLTIATIFTYSANEEEDELGYLEDENPEAVGSIDPDSRSALERAIKDYNKTFSTNYSTDGDSFQSYYKDVSLRMKQKDIDILIVVGMFLTGFDAKTLNTLWVDKNLKMHGLIQAYSRTNRILNAVKNCGNIVCFRNLEKATNDALTVFGDENAGGVVIMKTFEEYYETGYKDDKGKDQPPYKELAEQLLADFPVGNIIDIFDVEEKKRFVKLFNAILRLRNLLQAFDDFTPEKGIISEGDVQDYLTWYNSIREEVRPNADREKDSIEDDIEFEMDLVKQVQIDIPYILQLVQQYHDRNCEDKELLVKIKKSVTASPDMRDKKELIERFIERMTPESGGDVTVAWEEYCEEQKRKDLDMIIEEENLRKEQTYEFIRRAFANGYVTESGTEPARILPPENPFLPQSGNKKQRVLDKLKAYLQKYLNI